MWDVEAAVVQQMDGAAVEWQLQCSVQALSQFKIWLIVSPFTFHDGLVLLIMKLCQSVCLGIYRQHMEPPVHSSRHYTVWNTVAHTQVDT